MLRKKLLARLGLLVIGFVTGSVVSLALLQGVLRDLDDMKTDATTLVDGVQELSAAFAALEDQADAHRKLPGTPPEALATRKAVLVSILDRLATHPALHEGRGAAALATVRRVLPAYLADVDRESPGVAPEPEVLARATELRENIATMAGEARRHVSTQQSDLSRRLRWLIVGLTIAALAMTNIAIVVLVRTAGMILRPVDELISGSRELAREHFSHRIRISQSDEFDELARAYNALAGQLQANEERKVVSLQQLGVSLNHELNNAISVIELQLKLLERKSGGDPVLAAHSRQMREHLDRMARIIASLRQLRRIVLTEYAPGQPMLDLPRCVDAEAPVPPAEPAGVGGPIP
jgi:HAMP domain-containing protein